MTKFSDGELLKNEKEAFCERKYIVRFLTKMRINSMLLLNELATTMNISFFLFEMYQAKQLSDI